MTITHVQGYPKIALLNTKHGTIGSFPNKLSKDEFFVCCIKTLIRKLKSSNQKFGWCIFLHFLGHYESHSCLHCRELGWYLIVTAPCMLLWLVGCNRQRQDQHQHKQVYRVSPLGKALEPLHQHDCNAISSSTSHSTSPNGLETFLAKIFVAIPILSPIFYFSNCQIHTICLVVGTIILTIVWTSTVVVIIYT